MSLGFGGIKTIDDISKYNAIAKILAYYKDQAVNGRIDADELLINIAEDIALSFQDEKDFNKDEFYKNCNINY